MISVNGIRLKRSDLTSLSDVDLEKEIQQESTQLDERTRRSGSGADSLLGFLIGKITQKISGLSGASSGGSSGSGHSDEPDHSYGPPVTVSLY